MISSWRYARYQRKAGCLLHGALHEANRVQPSVHLTPEVKLYSSLTQALRKRHQSVSIRVLDQGWRACSASDRRFIAPNNRYGQNRRFIWTRHVLIYVGNMPMLYARALWLSQGRQPGWFTQLGRRSLGDEVFKRRHGSRLWMRIYREHSLDANIKKNQNNIKNTFEENFKKVNAESFMIARRSELKCQNAHLLLTEYFLEEMTGNNNINTF